jgi:hypothetical protein
MIDKIIHYTSWVILIMAVSLMLLFGFLLFYPFNPATFYKGSFQTSKQQYHRGEILDWTLKYNKHYAIPCQVTRMFIDGIIYQLPTVITNNPVGEQNFVNRTLKIPEELPPGHYRMRTVLIYKVNPFRDISYTFDTNMFEILADDCDAAEVKKDIEKIKEVSYGYQDYLRKKGK